MKGQNIVCGVWRICYLTPFSGVSKCCSLFFDTEKQTAGYLQTTKPIRTFILLTQIGKTAKLFQFLVHVFTELSLP